MAGEKLPTVEVISGQDGGPMYFVGSREISKPQLLEEPVGDIVAFSDTGLDGKRRVFTACQLSEVKNMPVSTQPDWL